MMMLGTVVFGLMAVMASWGVVYCSALLLLAGMANCGPDSLLTGSITMTIGKEARRGGTHVQGGKYCSK